MIKLMIVFFTSKFTIFTLIIKNKKIFVIFREKKFDKITKRKEKVNDIRKKIKSRFHKIVKHIINENLKKQVL